MRDNNNNNAKISNLYCFFTTWKSSVGVGAYAVPYLFYEASPLIGLVIFSLTVIVTSYTSLLMIDMHDVILSNPSYTNNIQSINGKKRASVHDGNRVLLSYSDVAQIMLGPFGYYLSFFSIIIGMWGSCTAYIVFLKQNLYTFAIENHDNIHLNETLIPILLTPLLILLLLFKNIKKLSIINILGILSFVVIIVIVFVHSFQKQHIWTFSNIQSTFWRLPSFDSLVIAFGIASFCMEGLIVCSIPIYESMKHCNYKTYRWILTASMGCFTATYSVFAMLGCLEYTSPQSSILLNFDEHSIFYCIVAYFCCLQILLTYPLVSYSYYILCEQSVLGSKYINTSINQYMFRICLILSTVIVAMFIPQYGAFLSFLGCIGNAATIFWIPSACYLMRYHNGFGILWINCLLCGKCKISSSVESYSILMDRDDDNDVSASSCIGKWIAVSVLSLGVLCSVVGMYISIRQEI